jgi:Arc/MetJ-type ribon-helix-helix transcriptional regulator
MTIHLPENLESYIREAVHSAQFPSVDEAMAEAARLLLQQIKQHPPRHTGDAAGHQAQAEDEAGSQELQRRLFNAGLLRIEVISTWTKQPVLMRGRIG